MEQIESLRTILKFGAIALFILSIFFLKQGRKMARRGGRRFNGMGKKLPPVKTQPANVFKFSEESIWKAMYVFKHIPHYHLAFDTNVLLDYPYLLANLEEGTKILISDQVRRELDRIKDGDSEVSNMARIALKFISNLHKDHKLEIVPVDKKRVEELGLDPNSSDDLIIGSYLDQVKDEKQIVFITNDNNARTTARTTKLKVLELDWEESLLGTSHKAKKTKTPVYRPGYAYKLFAIIAFSLSFGFLGGMMYLEKKMQQEGQPAMAVSSSLVSSEKGGPAYVKGDYPYVIKNEYGISFQGKKAGEWGAGAIVDIHRLSDPLFGTHQVVLGVWNTKSVQEKRNKLTYVIVLKNGKQYESSLEFFSDYKDKQAVPIPSVDSDVKFENVNGYDQVYFRIQEHEIKNLENAELRLVHKVTKEVIQTLPLKVLKK
jgi:rRNA-processing protein FCF1